MALYGYVPKHKPALWRTIHPEPPKAPKTAPKPPRKRIRAVSKRKQAVTAEYRKVAGAAVAAANKAGLTCPVVAAIASLRDGFRYGHPISGKITEVHHRFGRIGELLLWTPGWLLLSKQGHRWVHEHVGEARARGWIAPEGLFNSADRSMEFMVGAGPEWKTNVISG